MKILIKQAIKHIAVGGIADLVDIGVFNLLLIFLPAQIIVKTSSFIIAATIKYFGNKIWVFEKNDGHSIRESIQFLLVTLVGLIVHLLVFYCATMTFPDTKIWTEFNVVLSIGITAIWNFFGYKLLVFKK